MTKEERAHYVEAFIEKHCKSVMDDKGQEYSRGEEDCNSNFKRLAEELGLSPEQINWVYLKKHLDSIAYAVKTGKYDGTEPIEGRIGDAINYLFILASLIHEGRLTNIKLTATEMQKKYPPSTYAGVVPNTWPPMGMGESYG